MQGSILVHQLRKVISLVDLLRDIGLDKQLSLPKVVVLGNQSSGKSSLLEQIVGLDFLPRGSGVVTRRPLQLRMNNVQGLKEPYAEFDQVVEGGKKKRFTNFNEVRKMIDEVTDKVCGSKKVIKDIPIVLNIFSPNCPNLTIVDLPGITSIPVGDQPKNIYQITREMAFRYIKQPRSIILCVIPANQDLTTSEALKLMRQIDPKGERSIGCLTKIDIMNRGDDATKMLRNQEVPLRYGYVGVKNRCQEDVINNVPVTDSLKAERQFFTKSPIYSILPRDLFSTESLTKKLTAILYQQIKASIPQIFQQIKTKRKTVQEQLSKLGPGIANTDGQLVNYAWKSISKFMKIFTNSINGIKNTDYPADPISSQIRQLLVNIYKQQYDEPATIDLSDKDIQKAMINFPGDSTIPGFPSIDAFLALLNPLLKKLMNPAYTANNSVHEIMDHEATKIINEIMIKKFPQFNTRFNDLIRRVLDKHKKELETFLSMLLDAQISYLYTNDLSYLMGDFAVTEKEKKKISEGKIKDPLVFELRKRINSYFKLVVRNLRDLVPRQIFNFLIVKCLKQLEFEAFQFTSDVKKLKEWLNQPEEIRVKRQECVKAIKVFDESEKRIRMDPEISKLIRDNKKEEKFSSKLGIKPITSQQQQPDSYVAKVKNYEEKQKKQQQQQAQQAQQQVQQQAQQQAQQQRQNQGGNQGSSGQGQGQSNPQTQRPPAQVPSNQQISSSNQIGTQGMNKSPSQASNTSTNSGAEQPKINPSLFSMFGTNVAPTNNPSPNNQQQVPMPKQNPGVSPINQPQSNPLNSAQTQPKPSQPTGGDTFQDFWNNSSKTNNTQGQQPVQNPAVKPNVAPIQPVVVPPTNTTNNKPADKPKGSTFNQLFGLASKPS